MCSVGQYYGGVIVKYIKTCAVFVRVVILLSSILLVNTYFSFAKFQFRAPSTTRMDELCKLPFFDWAYTELDSFVERLEYVFTIRDIVDENKNLTQMDDESYNTIRINCRPALPKEKSYADLKEVLRRYCCKTESRPYLERRKFYNEKQNANSGVLLLVDRLRAQAIKCNFQEGFDDILRDRFISGLLPKFQAKFFELSDENISFEDAIHIALIEEASHIEHVEEKKNKRKK